MLLCCIGDICTILMDSSTLDINQYADLLLPPIIAKWNLLGDFDEGLLSILECLYYLIGVSGIKVLISRRWVPISLRWHPMYMSVV